MKVLDPRSEELGSRGDKPGEGGQASGGGRGSQAEERAGSK